MLFENTYILENENENKENEKLKQKNLELEEFIDRPGEYGCLLNYFENIYKSEN